MILKVKRKIDGGWTYYDGIKTAEVYNNETDKCVVADITDSLHNCKLAVNTEAYLMNDNGKTLQVVHG